MSARGTRGGRRAAPPGRARIPTPATATATPSYTRTNEKSTSFVIPADSFGPGLPPADTTITFPVSPNIYVASIMYQYPLYSGGRLEAQIALAKAGVKGSEAAFERTKQKIMLQTKLAYFQVLVGQAGLQVAQQGGTP